MHPPPLQLGGGGLKISEKSLLGGGGSEILILVGVLYCWDGRSRNFEVKIKTA